MNDQHEGNNDPPRFGPFGPVDPPRSSLGSALFAYLEGEPSEQDPTIAAGRRSLNAYLDTDCGKRPQNWQGTASKPVQCGRQSARNWRFTLVNELSRRADASANGKMGKIVLSGGGTWQATALDGAALAQEAQDAINAAKVANMRLIEIASQASAIELLFALEIGVTLDKHARTIDLIETASAVIAAPLYDVKRKLDIARPSEVVGAHDAPLIPVPGHASFPSGHATAAHALAELLVAVTAAGSVQKCRLRLMAHRLAENRFHAGLHTCSDTNAGKALGITFGEWLASSGLRNSNKDWGRLYDLAACEWRA